MLLTFKLQDMHVNAQHMACCSTSNVARCTAGSSTGNACLHAICRLLPLIHDLRPSTLTYFSADSILHVHMQVRAAFERQLAEAQAASKSVLDAALAAARQEAAIQQAATEGRLRKDATEAQAK